LPRRKWPRYLLKHKEVKGICVGKCVARKPKETETVLADANAHAHLIGSYSGWICVLKPEGLRNRSLMLHELAHVLTGGNHSLAFLAKLEELHGGKLPKGESVLRSVLLSLKAESLEELEGLYGPVVRRPWRIVLERVAES
jgi:hypothetical protein